MSNKTKQILKTIFSYLPTFYGVVALGFLFAPMFVFTFKDKSVEPANVYYVTHNIISFLGDFQPFHFTFIIFLLLIISGSVFSIIHKKHKTFGFISIFSFVLALCLFFMQGQFYAYNNVEWFKESTFAWGGIITSISLCLATVFEFVISYQNDQMTVREIAEDGMLIALALVLNFIKIPVGATGGSINLQMLPLFVIALRRGPLHGLIASGVVYGLVSNFADMYPITCYPFDYLIGFGGTAVMGLFNHWIMKDKTTYNVMGEFFLFIGGVSSVLIRWFGSSISSVVNFNVTFVEGLAYNVIYVFPSGIVTIIILMASYGPLLKLNNFINRKKTITIENE